MNPPPAAPAIEGEEMREAVARFWWDRVCPASFVGRWDDAKRYPGMLAELVAETYEDAEAILASGPLAQLRSDLQAARDERDDNRRAADDMFASLNRMGKAWLRERKRADAAEATASQLSAKVRELEKFVAFVVLWRDRGPPHGDPVTAWSVVSNHPVVSRARSALASSETEKRDV